MASGNGLVLRQRAGCGKGTYTLCYAYGSNRTGSLAGCTCKFNNDGSISNVTGWMEAPHNLKLKAEEGK